MNLVPFILFCSFLQKEINTKWLCHTTVLKKHGHEQSLNKDVRVGLLRVDNNFAYESMSKKRLMLSVDQGCRG